MYQFHPDPRALAMIAGAVLSLLFSYIPGLNTWFAGHAPEFKRLFMAGLMLVVAGAALGLSCAGIISGVACTQAGAIELAVTWILAVAANQATYDVSPQPAAVKLVKAQAQGDAAPVRD